MTRLREVVPPTLIAAGYAGLVAAVALHWRADPSAVDRYLVVAGAVVALLVRWKAATAAPTPRPLVGLPLLALGSLLYPLGWAGYFVLANARSLPFWLLWLSLLLVSSGWLLARFGGRAAYRLLFPLVFVAFALPPPESLLHQFQQHLQAITTTVSERALRLFGYEVTRPGGGFLLVLPGGELGVEETCSGVKALTALTAVAAFAAFWKRFGLVRGLTLIVSAVPVVVLVNVLRVTVSGMIQEAFGSQYIRGGWHDAVGFGSVLAGLGVVLLVAKVLAPKRTTPASNAPSETPTAHVKGGRLASALLLVSLFATLPVVWHGRTLVPPPVPAPPLDDLSPKLGDWTEHRRPPVPSHVTELLQPDVTVHREYRNGVGHSATVWVIYWTSAHSVRGYHHPDLCLPNVGFQEQARDTLTLTPSGGGELPLTSRTLAGPSGELFVLYWTQTGRRVWGPVDEQEASAGMRFDRLVGRAVARWTDPTPPEPAGRLVVLIGSPNAGEFGRVKVKEFAKLLADDVFRLCPSAAVPTPP